MEIHCESNKNNLVNVDEKFCDELQKRIERINQGMSNCFKILFPRIRYFFVYLSPLKKS